jgi:hypothetical protein
MNVKPSDKTDVAWPEDYHKSVPELNEERVIQKLVDWLTESFRA